MRPGGIAHRLGAYVTSRTPDARRKHLRQRIADLDARIDHQQQLANRDLQTLCGKPLDRDAAAGVLTRMRLLENSAQTLDALADQLGEVPDADASQLVRDINARLAHLPIPQH
jgi:hypothetical protein